MTLTTEPYLVIRTLERELVVHDITYPWRIRLGPYRVRVGDQWHTMEVGEPHYTTGSRLVRRIKLYAVGATAAAQMDLEAILWRGVAPLQLVDANQEVFDVGGVPVGSMLYLAGDFLGDRDTDEFPFRITFPTASAIHGFTMEQAWRGGRAVALDDLDEADERSLIQAMNTLSTSLEVTRLPWAEATWPKRPSSSARISRQKVEVTRGGLRWLRGIEPASPEMLEWITRQDTSRGRLQLQLVTRQNTVHSIWLNEWQGQKINAAMGLPIPTAIFHRKDPRRIEMLEEVCWQAQLEIPNFYNQAPFPQDELHVKDFMIRHRERLGITPADVRILQEMMHHQINNHNNITVRPLVLPESAEILIGDGPPRTGPDPLLELSLDDVRQMMQDEIDTELDLTRPRE